MADRFWVGGAGTWNTSSTTNWSATSGGPSGASAPTAVDDVFFNQVGTYTVTITGGLCRDLTVSANTVTLSIISAPLTISGSMTLVAGTIWTSGFATTFNATTTGKTITTNGVSIAGLTFGGIGGGWTLGSALTSTSAISVNDGSFNSGNFSITSTSFSSASSSTRSVDFGSSTVTISVNSSTALNLGIATGLTWNAGTSQINLTGGTTGITSGGLTFNNVSFTSTSSTAVRTIAGANTFNNFFVTGPSVIGASSVTFDSQQTINGTLSTTNTAGNRRIWFRSAAYGISQDLVVNSAPSLTNADFRGLYVRGTAAPISGTRIGNRGECRGITFSTPKTVYWNLSGTQAWSANAWAATSTGAPNTDNFPLPQDTATFTNAGAATTVQLNSAIGYVPTIDLSARTTAFTLTSTSVQTVYGNWINGSGVNLTISTFFTFSGGINQTITSAGKSFNNSSIFVDTYGGTVQLADALNVGFGGITVTNGTFNTAGYSVNCASFSSNNSNVRTITLGASALTLQGTFSCAPRTNLTLNAGTSSITLTGQNNTVSVDGRTLYNLSFSNTVLPSNCSISGDIVFNNLTVTAPASAGVMIVRISGNNTINGTLTCAGASVLRRIIMGSDAAGTPRTLTVNAISATDCDFRDINLAGAASGASPTRAGDCGGNTGITFPVPKTVYWNLAGAQNWSATAWAPGSGGTPDINNFPLAQDTAVFDDVGAAGTITISAEWNVGTFDALLRTSAMTLNFTSSISVHGDWKLNTGVAFTGSTVLLFSKNALQTIVSNGVPLTGCGVSARNSSGSVQLADALSLVGNTLTVTGTFDAATYNVSVGRVVLDATATVRMGSGTWTLSATNFVWDCNVSTVVVAGSSTIVLSSISSLARTFAGASKYYNKLTIGGATGGSTLNITGNNTFGELASTKTVSHAISFGTTNHTFGKWSVTGTAGNVVTITGTSGANTIAGPAVTGIDYLAMGSWAINASSPGEFYAGANSTGTAAAPVFRTAAPAPRTLYWVGGTGNWSSTTKWDTTSGGGGGAAIPTSLDEVNFDSLSNATAYTATIDAGVTLARCASFTMAGPLVGNVTFAGSVGIAFHGNVSFAATGITRSYTGPMGCAGNSSYTFTPNGLVFGSSFSTNGIGATWTLGSALNIQTSFLLVNYGSFSTSGSNYAITAATLSSSNLNIRSINLNGSTLTLSGNPITFTISTNLTFNAGTSTILASAAAPSFFGGGQTFNTASFTNTGGSSATVSGQNTFNNFTVVSQSVLGIYAILFSANQTISTLTLNAGTASAYRTFLASNTIGTTRTLTVGTLTAGAADIDFRDITIAGAAAPISGTRFGDAKGNSGITFPAAKTVYYVINLGAWGAASGGSWGATSGGVQDATMFPLAQDTAVFPASTTPPSGGTVAINHSYNIGTIDMSLRTSNTMTLATSTNTPAIYGNWINGTGTTLTGTGQMTFAGRGAQTITSAGRTFTQGVRTETPGGSVTLQDAFVTNLGSSAALPIIQGTFDAANYNVTLSGAAASGVSISGTLVRTVAIGSGTWTISGPNGWGANSTNLTITGTGTINLTSSSGKQFDGGNANYSGITLNQGGAGTLTITGNNTFKTITNTYSATGATTIALGTTTQTLTQPWTATGAAGRVLTISGTSAASPATLIFSGGGQAANVDYLAINNVRAYNLTDTWYAGANSTNGGSLGWVYASGVIATAYLGNFFAFF